MILETLRLGLALALLVILPGFLLVQALFPRPGALSRSERVYLTLGGGVLVTMLVGIVLGFLPHGDRGFLSSLATGGMPNVEVLMIVASVGLFYLGAARGAYPELALRYPRFVLPWLKATPAGTTEPPQAPGP